MNSRDHGETSHVEFLRSIRFAQGSNRAMLAECPKEHFASFVPHAREGRVITKGASWNCREGACKAMSNASRPNILCERLAKEVGTLASFTVDGRAMDEADLAKCNAKAK